jgi:hypothetical protein
VSIKFAGASSITLGCCEAALCMSADAADQAASYYQSLGLAADAKVMAAHADDMRRRARFIEGELRAREMLGAL